jgi:hypothetical protein
VKRDSSSSRSPVMARYSSTAAASMSTFPEPAQCRSRPSRLDPRDPEDLSSP